MSTKTKKRKTLKSLAHIRKLSTLLALGLRDFRKQERAKNSEVDMTCWLKRNGKCVACVAGSVLRFSMGVRRTAEARDYADNDRPTYRALHAINYLRCGYISHAAALMRVTTSFGYRHVADYHNDRKQFWSDMRQLLKDLRAAGE